jgi:hypothetical protein
MTRGFFIVLVIGFVGSGLAFACGESGPRTSSSSHWIACERDDDCSAVPGAEACVDGYCVDAAGDPVTPAENGGSGGNGASGNGGEAGGGAGDGAVGGQGGDGSTAGAGAGGQAGGGGGSVGAGGEASCLGPFYDDLKSCATEQDCSAVSHRIDLCGSHQIVGVRSDDVPTFEAIEDACLMEFPGVPCPSAASKAEDGRLVASADDVIVDCVDGSCRTEIAVRDCGDAGAPDLTCGAGEICLATETVIGPTSSVEYSCEENPCSGPLSCDCAETLCSDSICAGPGLPWDILCQDPRQ